MEAFVQNLMDDEDEYYDIADPGYFIERCNDPFPEKDLIEMDDEDARLSLICHSLDEHKARLESLLSGDQPSEFKENRQFAVLSRSDLISGSERRDSPVNCAGGIVIIDEAYNSLPKRRGKKKGKINRSAARQQRRAQRLKERQSGTKIEKVD
jgi:hypothetical protein